MSDLAAKFTALESQMTTQQTEVINALNAILDALGAPPPTATVTLATVAAQLTTMNTNIVAIATANAGFYSALLDAVGAINTNTDTIITNNSLNAQRLLTAIISTSCPCPTDAPLLSPPIDVTPTSLADEAKCRRIQFYLSVFGDWLTKIANYGSATGFVTGAAIDVLLANAITAAGIVASGAEVGAVAGPPGIVIAAVISLIVLAISVYGGSVLVDYANQFNASTMKAALLAAMYPATTADEGYTAFKSTLLANMDTIPAEIIYTLWWSAWSNDIYSGSPVVDDSAFDGSICGPSEPTNPGAGECYTILTEDSFTMTKTLDNGDNWTTWVIPSWADTVQWDVEFSAGLNLALVSIEPVEGSDLTGILGVNGFAGRSTGTYTAGTGVPTFFTVGAFYAGHPNGTTVGINVHSLRACVNA
jgi:hypothetical protein